MLSEKRIPGGTPLGKVIGRGGMESNVAAATVPPVATATGVASLIASKTSATVSANESYNLVKVKLFSKLEFIHSLKVSLNGKQICAP